MNVQLCNIDLAQMYEQLNTILSSRSYSITHSSLMDKLIVGYSTESVMRTVQIIIDQTDNFFEIKIHCTCYSKGSFFLTNDTEEESILINEITAGVGDFNSFRLSPSDYFLC